MLYLGVTAQITNWTPASDEFILVMDSNPLTEFVEVPENLASELKLVKNELVFVVRNQLMHTACQIVVKCFCTNSFLKT